MEHMSMSCAPPDQLPAHHDQCKGWVYVTSGEGWREIGWAPCVCDCPHPLLTAAPGRNVLDRREIVSVTS